MLPPDYKFSVAAKKGFWIGAKMLLAYLGAKKFIPFELTAEQLAAVGSGIVSIELLHDWMAVKFPRLKVL